MFGNLIEFEENKNSNKENIDIFVDKTSKDRILETLSAIMEHVQSLGVFTMEESYMVYSIMERLQRREEGDYDV